MNTQNNNFTVENLVAKYRDYVKEHCPKKYDVSEWVDENGKSHFEEIYTPCSPKADAGEQLLTVIYKKFAGDNAQKDIVEALSQFSNAYYPSVLTEEETAFLCKNYKETVEYLFAHRDEWTAGIKYHLNKISEERERLVKEYAKPKDGTTVFIADTEYCDLAVQFPNCIIKGFTGGPSLESKAAWALGQIRMWALGIKSEIVSGERAGAEYTYPLPEKGSVDMVILRANADKYNFHKILGTACTDLDALYDLLKPNGKMIFFSESKSEMAGIQNESTNEMVHKFLRRVIKDCAVESIVSFEDDNNGLGEERTTGIMLVISKSNNQTVCVRNERLSLSKEIPASCIDSDILWPSYYLTEKPENGIALSEIVSYINLHEVKWMMVENKESTLEKGSDKLILSERIMKMVVAHPSEMANDYKDANLCQASLKKAGDSTYEVLRGMIVPVEQPSILLYGRKDRFVVGYMKELPKDGMATLSPVACLVPKNGIDVRYVAALLFTPDVKNQIISVCEGDISGWTFPLIMDKIIVPNHDEKERLSFLLETNYNALVSSQKEMKENFEKEIANLHKKHQSKLENYQHGMRKPIREIGSAIRRMERSIRANIENVEIKDFLLQRIMQIKNHKESLSEDIERLNEENTYGEPVVFDIDHCLKTYINYFGKDIDIRYQNEISKRLIEQYEASMEYLNHKPIDKPAALDAKIHELSPIFVDIAEYNFKKIVKCILDNADDHGFLSTKHEKCIIEIDLDWDNDMDKFRIDFRNNGSPLPKGLTKEIYGEYKRYVGKTGKNGIGGYEVADNVKHYGGDFTLFQDKDWAVIRIYLPKSKVYERL